MRKKCVWVEKVFELNEWFSDKQNVFQGEQNVFQGENFDIPGINILNSQL